MFASFLHVAPYSKDASRRTTRGKDDVVMLIHRATRADIEHAARVVGVAVDVRPYRGAWRVKVNLGADKRWMRRAGNCRRIGAVCWHGFEAFFVALFNRCPNASADTRIIYYKRQEGFLRDYRYTATRNIGSSTHPVMLQDACDCTILAHPRTCDCCGTLEGVTYKRHGWERVTKVCKNRTCRRAVRAVELLRGRRGNVSV